MAQVLVNIAGRSYRMACEDGEEERLAGLGRTVDERIANMRSVFGEIGDQRLVVMAAISIADDLAELRQRLASAQADLDEKQARMAEDGRLHEIWAERLAGEVDHASERLERLARALNGPGRE